MPRSPRHDILFEPIAIGPKTLRNRFYQTAHATGFGSEYPGAQARYRGMRAEGGWAAVSLEYFAVHPESDDAPYVQGRMIDADDVANVASVAQSVHDHGSLAGIELTFSGPDHTGYDSRLPSRGVSQLTSTLFGGSCWEMSVEEIHELQNAYVRSARLARDAGIDMINIAGREAFSITQQFLMRYWNKRTDKYGGTLENRARFWLETLALVRDAVGDDCAIVCGLCLDTRGTGGDDGIHVQEDGIGFIRLADHLVDLWDLQTSAWLEDAGPSRYFEQNSQRRWIAQAREHTDKPIVGVGRFTDPEAMVAAITSGQLDLIGASRPAIADPFLPRKIEQGRYEDIRECIGCNVCVARYHYGGGRIVCTQNATTGEEFRRGWHPERFTQSQNHERGVLIVGAGPAGMECARVLGERGMDQVHLVDAHREIGGIMRWISAFTGLAEWARVTHYRRSQLERMPNVQIAPRTLLSADDVRDYGAQVVILAVGAHWSRSGLNPVTHRDLPGWDHPGVTVLTPEDVMVSGRDTSGRQQILVYDTDGYFMGASLAEHLALAGRAVTFVTNHSEIAPYMFLTGEGAHMYRRLHQLGVTLITDHQVTRLRRGSVEGMHLLSGEPTSWPADAVLVTTQRQSDTALYDDLLGNQAALAQNGIENVLRIGDCLEPRAIADVIFDGHRLGREIDSPDPARPLAFIREHRVVGKVPERYETPPVTGT